MPSVDVRTLSGGTAGSVDLPDEVFGIEPNVPVLHQVVTAQLAARRAGTQSTLTRAEVRGGGAKPYRQKGTGRARQGSIRAPQFVGGGVAHGPKPRSYRQKVNKKMGRLAIRSALSDRASEGRIVVVDGWSFDRPSTKAAVRVLADLGVDGKVLVVVGTDDDVATRSFRNLTHVQVVRSSELNPYDILCNDWLVFSRETLPAGDREEERVGSTTSGSSTEAAPVVAEAAPVVAEAAPVVAEAAPVVTDAPAPEAAPTADAAASISVEDDSAESSETTAPEAAPTAETTAGADAEPGDDER